MTPINKANLANANLVNVNNGVIQTSRSLDTILSLNDSESAYHLCMTQGRGIRYFSNSCTKLLDALRKKMNRLAIEADLQIQAEKIEKKPISKSALARIAMLSKINLLSTQTEDTIISAQNSPKNNDSREDIPEIMASIKKVQISVAGYTRLFQFEKL